jgi:hypothetical protein
MIVSGKLLKLSQELNPASIIITSYSRASFAIVLYHLCSDRFIHTGTADFGVLQLKKVTTIMVRDKGYFS